MTQMGMGSAQAINAAWLTSKMSDYKRPVALAAYVMSIQLAGFPGNQLFRAQGKTSPSFKRTHTDPGRCSSLPTRSYHRRLVRHCRRGRHSRLEVAVPHFRQW